MGNPETEEQEYYSLTKKAFDKLAPFYDFVTAPFSKLRDDVVEFAAAPADSRILDVATGTGKQAFAYARRGYDVTGIDLTEAMLRIARGKNKYPKVRFQAADATKLPFEDRSFDVSCISFALHDMPLSIREKVLKEMVRVTNPAGTIVVVDYGLPQNRIGRFLIRRFVSLYEGKYYQGFIRADLRALLGSAGIAIKEERRAVLGAARIVKAARA
ncbi:MAG: 2-heptaprenyl-1,4-naphthoquinone methyltransferase [Dehalococcoidia bacterium]|nr:2-heptaprenyl-1,4-naphthoquinone methyltransferase [Dehalococcoidia bacterium]